MSQIHEADMYEAYRVAEGLSKAEQARALNISRQRLNGLYNGAKAETDVVMDWFQNGSADWVREMALDIFTHRPYLDVPCVCETEIGDNGPCPRHAAVLIEDPQ